MKKYLSAIVVFDVLLPALLLGVPGCILLLAFTNFQNFAAAKVEEFSQHQMRLKQVAALQRELQPVEAKMPLLKALLSNNDIEARLNQSMTASLDKFSSDQIERTLREFLYGSSVIGANLGEGRRLSLKFSSRWETLNAATLEWETRFPNLVLETLSIRRAPESKLSGPYLESALSYFVITEN
jgi:hypothetical protein